MIVQAPSPPLELCATSQRSLQHVAQRLQRLELDILTRITLSLHALPFFPTIRPRLPHHQQYNQRLPPHESCWHSRSHLLQQPSASNDPAFDAKHPFPGRTLWILQQNGRQHQLCCLEARGRVAGAAFAWYGFSSQVTCALQDMKLMGNCAEQFRVLRKKGTEAPGSSKLDKHYPDAGVYTCAGCEAPLYKANHKFDSGCGWPAFWDAFPDAVGQRPDPGLGMMRTEIVCNNCGGHLGHIFKGERFGNPKDERHCVNGVSINFSPESK